MDNWRDRRLVHWLMTLWCNYKCSYCRQPHERKQTWTTHSTPNDNRTSLRVGGSAHWADNASPEEWDAAFRQHFSDVPTVFTLTGGEPFLHRRPFEELLRLLGAWAERVRVDTNLSWDPSGWDVNKERIALMASYHPEHTSEKEFLMQLDAARYFGWTVAMVNLVMVPAAFSAARSVEPHLKARKIAFVPGAAYGTVDQYTDSELDYIASHVHPLDRYYRFGGRTFGVQCHYPSVSCEVDPDGGTTVSCHDSPGSVFGELPKLPTGPVPCPHKKCTCVDRYTFAAGLNGGAPTPLEAFAERTLAMELPLCE